MKIVATFTKAVITAGLMFGGMSAVHSFAPIAAAQAGIAKQIVDQAKADGLIGEQIDGYLGLVSAGASADLVNAMNEINSLRKSAYTKLARAQGVSVDDVAGLTGEKLIAKAEPGEMVKLADGRWHRK